MTTQNQVFFDHIRTVLGGEVGDISEGEYLRLAADWFSAAHAWQFLMRPLRLDLRGRIDFSGATYTHATRRLVKVGAFEDYTYVAGDGFDPTAGADVALRRYALEQKVDDDTIVLAAPGLGADADGDSDIGGRLPNDSLALPADFMAFVGQRPLRSDASTVRALEFTSHEVLAARRGATIDSDGSGCFVGVLTELINGTTGMSDPVLEIFPGVSENVADAFRGYYRARLVIDPTSEQSIVPLPSGRPALELALIKAARAFALGMEEGEEVGKPSLEQLLRNLVESDIWRAARKQDGLQQPTVGPIRGGVGEQRGAGRRMLATEVNGPS